MNVDKRKLWTAASVLILSGPLTAQQQPNIILFWWMIWGGRYLVPFWTETTELNQIYHTPNMERLFSKWGLSLPHVAANSISSPSR